MVTLSLIPTRKRWNICTVRITYKKRLICALTNTGNLLEDKKKTTEITEGTFKILECASGFTTKKLYEKDNL